MPLVKALLTLPVAQRLEHVQALWGSIALEQGRPGLDADAALTA